MGKTTARIMGVYVIRNLVTGEVYIGSSNNVRARLGAHRSSLRNGRHWLPRLQADWDALGEESFEMIVLEEVLSLGEIRSCEQRYLDTIRPYESGVGYNRSPSTNGVGWRYTEEQRARLAAALLGKPKTAEHRAKIWASREVTTEHRAMMSAVGRASRGVSKTAEQNRKNSEAQRGELNHTCKLTLDQCREIKRRLDAGDKGAHLAAEFGVVGSVVSHIKNGKHWSSRTAASGPSSVTLN